MVRRRAPLRDGLQATVRHQHLAQLKLSVSTAYARRDAARKAFAREWEALKLGDAAAVAAFALFSVEELIAASRESPIMPEALGEGFPCRPVEPVGPVSAGLESIARGTAAMAGAARVGFTVTRWQIAAGGLLLALGAGGAGAALGSCTPAPVPLPVPVATVDGRGTVAVASAPNPPASVLPEAIPSARPAPSTPPRPPRMESQTELLNGARDFLETHQPGKALVLLARVTDPDLAEARDELRARALRDQAHTTHP